MARSGFLVSVGGIAYFAIYASQAVVLTLFLTQHLNRALLGCVAVLYLPSLAYMAFFFCRVKVAEDDKAVRHIVAIWSLYIIPAFIPIVTTIFACIVGNLSSSDDLGPNLLRSMLCFTPGLLILLLTLTVSPKHLDLILALAIPTALDLFDGIELLEIILLQEHGFYKLNDSTKISIIVFASFSFLVSPATLLQYKISDGNSSGIKRREKMGIIVVFIQLILINFPFLVIRSFVWDKHGYESTVFIAKNIIAVVVGLLQIIITFGCECLKCGHD